VVDTNDDGYFDRWEYYGKDEVLPYRVASVPDADNRDIEGDWDALTGFYNKEVLPEAIRINRESIQALERFGEEYAPAVPAFLEKACRWISLRTSNGIFWIGFGNTATGVLSNDPGNFLRETAYQTGAGSRQIPEFRSQSTASWEDAVILSRIEEAYARGEWEKMMTLLETIRELH
jgi:hypothetical protein